MYSLMIVLPRIQPMESNPGRNLNQTMFHGKPYHFLKDSFYLVKCVMQQ